MVEYGLLIATTMALLILVVISTVGHLLASQVANLGYWVTTTTTGS